MARPSKRWLVLWFIFISSWAGWYVFIGLFYFIITNYTYCHKVRKLELFYRLLFTLWKCTWLLRKISFYEECLSSKIYFSCCKYIEIFYCYNPSCKNTHPDFSNTSVFIRYPGWKLFHIIFYPAKHILFQY